MFLCNPEASKTYTLGDTAVLDSRLIFSTLLEYIPIWQLICRSLNGSFIYRQQHLQIAFTTYLMIYYNISLVFCLVWFFFLLTNSNSLVPRIEYWSVISFHLNFCVVVGSFGVSFVSQSFSTWHDCSWNGIYKFSYNHIISMSAGMTGFTSARTRNKCFVCIFV